MKISTLPILISLCFLHGCNTPEPWMKQELNSVSPTSTQNVESDSFMQKRLDNWLKDEWEPITSNTAENNESNSSINNVSKEKEPEADFRLQDYVDKWKVYNTKKEKDSNKTYHNDKVEAMPVIGK